MKTQLISTLISHLSSLISDSTLAETFSNFFESAVKNLGISREINTTTDFESSDPVDIALSFEI